LGEPDCLLSVRIRVRVRVSSKFKWLGLGLGSSGRVSDRVDYRVRLVQKSTSLIDIGRTRLPSKG
jgi:hypothetical protein